MINIDLRGLTPAPVTPFTREGRVDYDAIQRLGSWLGSIDGVKGLVVLGHAGEGTFLTQEEQANVIRAFVKSVDGKLQLLPVSPEKGRKSLRWRPSVLLPPAHPLVCYILLTAGCVLAIRMARLRIVTAWFMKKVACR